ncbi:hypothetical protein BOTBODRAFT_57108 [Botryobasidium botryosum FD-172 SS1]|uniref:F-box domain-containing protein n=1 Tax=Botryobasidium botryosum (strain FD-172 SS1) TaxID=930990 RepID=A0A067M8Z6_BOTB1|nr:hypothetical protein BOTBODRAFT_57108 [Botryobasidium botryosum FD-172 SS1]
MDAIALNLVPLLIRELCKCSLEQGAQHHRENFWKAPIYSFNNYCTSFRLPNMAGSGTIEHTEEELRLVSLACEYATHAMSSYVAEILAAIKSRRNQHLPAYRLPNEVLAIIFQFAVESSSNRGRPLARKAPLNLSHVSSRWREVATTTARLWTKYDATNARIAGVILDRSKRAPLRVKLAPYDPYDTDCSSDGDLDEPCLQSISDAYRKGVHKFSDFIRPLLPHADRLEGMILEGIEGSSWEDLCFPAPNLRRLEVKTTEGEFDYDNPSLQVFVGATPLLHDLRLWRYGPPLTSPIYTGLVTLMLHDIYYDETVQDLFGVLAGCPRLKRLTLQKADLEPLGDPSLFHIDIHLPYLEEVVLSSLGQDVTSRILSSITASPTVQLQLKEEDWEGNLLGYVFQSRLFSSNVAPFCWARCKHAYYPRGAFAFDAGDFERGRRVKVVSPRAEAAIPNLAQDLPIQSLESLAFQGMKQAGLSVASFAQLLADLHYITSITLSYCLDPWPFVNALIATPSSILCPLLVELRFHGAYKIENDTLLEFARSRAMSSQHTSDGTRPRLTHLVFSNCVRLDQSTMLELRDLSLQVRVLPFDFQTEEMRFSRVPS